MADEELTNVELNELAQRLYGTTPSAEEKQNIHTFLNNVAISKDTTKTGNLSVEELGNPTLPLRTYQELELFCREVANMDYYAEYFRKKGEILTATSLSKDAKLLNLAVLQKREVEDTTKPKRKENKSWFKPKNRPPEQPVMETV
jgi:hypothetical protein